MGFLFNKYFIQQFYNVINFFFNLHFVKYKKQINYIMLLKHINQYQI